MAGKVEPSGTTDGAPRNAKVILGSLILVAAVANLNLSVANVALPSIGKSFDSSQTMLDLIAVGYSLGLAASVLWFGALGDRYGRKMMIVLGMLLAIPASLVAGFAPSDTVLFGARDRGRPVGRSGLSDDARAHHGPLGGRPGTHACHRCLVGAGRRHGHARPAHLRLPARSTSSGAPSSSSPSRWRCWPCTWPGGTSRPTSTRPREPVDNLGGVLSAVMIGALVIALNFITVPAMQTLAVGLLVLAVVVLIAVPVRVSGAPPTRSTT